MAVSAPSSTTSDVNVTSTPAVASTADTTVTADRFLKLLVAQMQNQDPLNPMDNAEVTSQMAQINTVTGIDKLNTTVQGLSSQFMQMQAVQGASLVGRDVIVPGNKLSIDETAAVGQGGFELTGPADAVKVDILSPSGAVVQTLNLGAAGAGVHSFDWPSGTATAASGLTFRVSATSGGVATTATALMRDRVDAVSTSGTTFNLELAELGHRAVQRGQGLQLAPRPAVSGRAFRKSIAMGFQQGLSGLNASSKSLEVIGNNIANANTVGAKSARAEFADVYANALGGSANNVGIGVSVAAVAQQFTQGTITATDNPLDVAINGNGFFEVKSPAGAVSYTRNGQFKADSDGFIVNDQGQQLMGYPADATGTIIPGAAGPLQMPTGGITPAVTTTIGMEMNLDSRLGVTLPSAGAPIDFADPSTYNNATSQTVYDAKGQDGGADLLLPEGEHRHLERLRRRQRHANHDLGRQPGGLDHDHVPEQRRRADRARGHGRDRHSLGHQRRRRDHGADHRRRPRRLRVPRSTARSSASPTLAQDGYAAGQLIGVSVRCQRHRHRDAIRTARPSRPASSSSPPSATRRDSSRSAATAGAQTARRASPVVGPPGAGNLGVLQAGAVEESNVDLTAELVNMITAQRAYQANAQTIKTEDQILQTIVNLR